MLFAPLEELVGPSEHQGLEVPSRLEVDPELGAAAPVAFQKSRDAEDHGFARSGDHVEVVGDGELAAVQCCGPGWYTALVSGVHRPRRSG